MTSMEVLAQRRSRLPQPTTPPNVTPSSGPITASLNPTPAPAPAPATSMLYTSINATPDPAPSSSVSGQPNSTSSSSSASPMKSAVSSLSSPAESATSGTSSSQLPQPTTPPSQDVHHRNSRGAIIGGTIGGIIGLVLLSSVVFVIYRRRKRESSASPLFDKEKFYSNRIRSRRADDALDGQLILTSKSATTTHCSVESSRMGGSIDALREKLLEMQVQSLSRKGGYSPENASSDAEISALRTYIERKEAEEVIYWSLDDPPP